MPGMAWAGPARGAGLRSGRVRGRPLEQDAERGGERHPAQGPRVRKHPAAGGRVWPARTRREPVPGGSDAASMPHTVLASHPDHRPPSSVPGMSRHRRSSGPSVGGSAAARWSRTRNRAANGNRRKARDHWIGLQRAGAVVPLVAHKDVRGRPLERDAEPGGERHPAQGPRVLQHPAVGRPVWPARTRREPVPGGSDAASMPHTVLASHPDHRPPSSVPGMSRHRRSSGPSVGGSAAARWSRMRNRAASGTRRRVRGHRRKLERAGAVVPRRADRKSAAAP
jgi:hypothetical protein